MSHPDMDSAHRLVGLSFCPAVPCKAGCIWSV